MPTSTDPALSHDADVRRVWSTFRAVDNTFRQLVVSTAARHSAEQLTPVLRINYTATHNKCIAPMSRDDKPPSRYSGALWRMQFKRQCCRQIDRQRRTTSRLKPFPLCWAGLNATV